MENKDNFENTTYDNAQETNLEKEDFPNKDEFIYCSKCGNKNPVYNKFCSKCGNKLKYIEDSIKETTNVLKTSIQNNKIYHDFTNISSDDSIKADWDNKDMVNFIQNNADYYIPKFKLLQDFNKSTSWNWASFFFTSNWFFYRKMYGIGIGIILLNLLSFIPFIGFIISIGIWVCSGIYGNTLYLKHIQKQLVSLTNINDDDVKNRIIITNGGTNLWLPIILCVLLPIVFSVIFSIISMSSLFMYY